MSRLTNAIRDQILKNEVSNTFDKKVNSARGEFYLSFENWYVASLPNIPEELLGTFVSITKSVRVINPYDSYDKVEVYFSKMLPLNFSNSKFTMPDRVKEKFDSLLKVEKEMSDFERKLKSLLYSTSSVKTLCELVPELHVYFTKNEKSLDLIPFQEISEIRSLLVRPIETEKK